MALSHKLSRISLRQDFPDTNCLSGLWDWGSGVSGGGIHICGSVWSRHPTGSARCRGIACNRLPERQEQLFVIINNPRRVFRRTDVFICHTLAKFQQGLHDILPLSLYLIHLNSPAVLIRMERLYYSSSSSSCTGFLHLEIAAEPNTFQLQVISTANSSDFIITLRISGIFPKAWAVGIIMKHQDLSFHGFK